MDLVLLIREFPDLIINSLKSIGLLGLKCSQLVLLVFDLPVDLVAATFLSVEMLLLLSADVGIFLLSCEACFHIRLLRRKLPIEGSSLRLNLSASCLVLFFVLAGGCFCRCFKLNEVGLRGFRHHLGLLDRVNLVLVFKVEQA